MKSLIIIGIILLVKIWKERISSILGCLVASLHAASHDVEWVFGMSNNELCVAPGNYISKLYSEHLHYNYWLKVTLSTSTTRVVTMLRPCPRMPMKAVTPPTTTLSLAPSPGQLLEKREWPMWCAVSPSTALWATRSWPSLSVIVAECWK